MSKIPHSRKAPSAEIAPSTKFSEETIWQVWGKGTTTNNDPLIWRKDACGAWILRGHYKNKNSTYGWKIAYIKPMSAGRTDDVSNLRPIHWQNHVREDGSLECSITSEGDQNIETS